MPYLENIEMNESDEGENKEMNESDDKGEVPSGSKTASFDAGKKKIEKKENEKNVNVNDASSGGAAGEKEAADDFPWVAMMLEGLAMMLEFVPLMYQPLLVAGEVMKNKVPAKLKNPWKSKNQV